MDRWIGIGWKGKKWGEGREKEGVAGRRWLEKCLFVDNGESEYQNKLFFYCRLCLRVKHLSQIQFT